MDNVQTCLLTAHKLRWMSGFQVCGVAKWTETSPCWVLNWNNASFEVMFCGNQMWRLCWQLSGREVQGDIEEDGTYELFCCARFCWRASVVFPWILQLWIVNLTAVRSSPTTCNKSMAVCRSVWLLCIKTHRDDVIRRLRAIRQRGGVQ